MDSSHFGLQIAIHWDFRSALLASGWSERPSVMNLNIAVMSSQISESKLDLLLELPLGKVPETSSCKWALTGAYV